MPRVVHFEITADQPERAIDFYKNIFGWKISKWDGPLEYWMVDTGHEKEPGIDGGISKRQNEGNGIYNIIEVESVDQYAEKVKSAGGEIVVPKHPVLGVGYFIYCRDTENNMFGIMHPDPDAE
jgi:predicted enzyme related to lactoylglutathione lyase